MLTARALPWILLAGVGIFAFGSPASASIEKPPNPDKSCASADYAKSNKVSQTDLFVVSGNIDSNHINTTRWVRMGQIVTVCVMGLYDWIYVHKNDPSKLHLLIGGQILANIPPSLVGPANQEYLNFNLQLDAGDASDWKAWAAIVDASHRNVNASRGKADASRGDNEEYNIPLSVASENTVFESDAFVKVIPYPSEWSYLLALFAVLLVALIYLAATTYLLRYTIGGQLAAPSKAPFSLGLVQMAFWFYLVLAAYVYICITTRQIHIPMGSVLGLLGISSTTGLAAVFVDKQKTGSAEQERNNLVAEQASLTNLIKDLSSTAPPAGSAAEKEILDRKSRLSQVDALLAQNPAAPPAPQSKGFLVDLLSDGDGVSFHRFQIAVWTIVLGIVFVWSVYRNISMPEFDASLLTLMGISSGTYVGFKFPEKLKT